LRLYLLFYNLIVAILQLLKNRDKPGFKFKY
jgi:hypothetical protein